MDQLRRGASIVATDLARAPPPATVKECYQLMCLTTPEVDQIEASISTLKEEIDMRKAAVADKETLLANHNPPVFQAVQVSSILFSHAGLSMLHCIMSTSPAPHYPNAMYSRTSWHCQGGGR